MIERIVNMDNPRDATLFLNQLRRLRGPYRFAVTKHRPRRSDRQNRYYWPCFVHLFAKEMRDQGQHVTDKEAHGMLKYRLLRESKVDHTTGEVFEFILSTASLDTAQFNEYLDRCAVWLNDALGIIVPDPADYHEKEPHDT